jgi:hypothetical protein
MAASFGNAVEPARGPVLFWKHLVYVATTHPNVLQRIIQHSASGAAARLRGVNRDMRAAVNRTVTSVTCDLELGLLDKDMATVFPGAYELRVCVAKRFSLRKVSANEVILFLDHVRSTSPMLMQQVHSVLMELGRLSDVSSIAEAVAEFMARCGDHTVHLHVGACAGPCTYVMFEQHKPTALWVLL